MKKMVLCFGFALLLSQCATTYQGNLEEARFALDNLNYEAAETAATKALNEKPGDIEASILLSNAHLGQSNIDFFDLAIEILGLDESGGANNFRTIALALPTNGDVSDLRLAVSTLQDLDGIDAATITATRLADAAYSLGVLQMVEHYARGVYALGFYDADGEAINNATMADNLEDLLDEGTSSNAAIVQNDLLEYDNYLEAVDVDTTQDFVKEVRQTFCVLSLLDGDKSDGFNESEYLAYSACNSANVDGANFDDINAVVGTIDNIDSCDDLDPDDQAADVVACYDEDTSLED